MKQQVQLRPESVPPLLHIPETTILIGEALPGSSRDECSHLAKSILKELADRGFEIVKKA